MTPCCLNPCLSSCWKSAFSGSRRKRSSGDRRVDNDIPQPCARSNQIAILLLVVKTIAVENVGALRIKSFLPACCHATMRSQSQSRNKMGALEHTPDARLCHIYSNAFWEAEGNV